MREAGRRGRRSALLHRCILLLRRQRRRGCGRGPIHLRRGVDGVGAGEPSAGLRCVALGHQGEEADLGGNNSTTIHAATVPAPCPVAHNSSASTTTGDAGGGVLHLAALRASDVTLPLRGIILVVVLDAGNAGSTAPHPAPSARPPSPVSIVRASTASQRSRSFTPPPRRTWWRTPSALTPPQERRSTPLPSTPEHPQRLQLPADNGRALAAAPAPRSPC